MFLLFLFLPYLFFAAVVAGPIGYIMPGLVWIAGLSAAILIVPPIFFHLTDTNSSHPGKMGEFLIRAAIILGAVIGLWAGYFLRW